MKTTIKIMLLVLFSIGAIACVFVFAKTRVAPPSDLKLVDQYSLALRSSVATFDTIQDFSKGHMEYVRLDDQLKRFLFENAIDSKVSDKYRQKIDENYGRNLIAYSYRLFHKSEWPEDMLNEMYSMLSSIRADKLTSGEDAVTEEFITSFEEIKGVIDDYRAALRLARNTSYNGIGDAASRIQKAKFYRSSEYLNNNTELVRALDALPGNIAQSHYWYINRLVNSLGSYYNLSRGYYMDTLIPKVDKEMAEYNNTKIYGKNKPSIAALENRAIGLVKAGVSYFDN